MHDCRLISVLQFNESETERYNSQPPVILFLWGSLNLNDIMSTEETEKATDSGADDEEWLYGGEISFLTVKLNAKATHLFICYRYLLLVISSGWRVSD